MSVGLLAIVTAIYVAVAVNYGRGGKWGMCLVFLAYALANVGLIIEAKRP